LGPHRGAEQLLRHPKIGTDLTHQAMARDDSYVSVNVNLIALAMHFVRCNVHGEDTGMPLPQKEQ